MNAARDESLDRRVALEVLSDKLTGLPHLVRVIGHLCLTAVRYRALRCHPGSNLLASILTAMVGFFLTSGIMADNSYTGPESGTPKPAARGAPSTTASAASANVSEEDSGEAEP